METKTILSAITLVIFLLIFSSKAWGYAYPTHIFISYLTAKSLEEKNQDLSKIINAKLPSFLAGGYLGADFQLMPYGVCPKCKEFFRAPLFRCPYDDEVLEEFLIEDKIKQYTRVEIEENRGFLYIRSHLMDANTPPKIFQWAANCIYDAANLDIGIPEKIYDGIAFTAGWFSHVISDAYGKGWLHNTPIKIFNIQYGSDNLPAIENLVVTWYSYDFGINWESLNQKIINDSDDNMMRPHYMLLDSIEKYKEWKGFSLNTRPDLKNLIETLEPINRRYAIPMYFPFTYSISPSPKGDPQKWLDFDFKGFKNEDIFNYSLSTGLLKAFCVMADDTANVLKISQEIKPIKINSLENIELSGPDFSLWKDIVTKSYSRDSRKGLKVDIPRGIEPSKVFNKDTSIIIGKKSRKLQKEIANKISEELESSRITYDVDEIDIMPKNYILIGNPAFNSFTKLFISYKDYLELKYIEGYEGYILLLDNPKYSNYKVLLIIGFSDYGDRSILSDIDKLI